MNEYQIIVQEYGGGVLENRMPSTFELAQDLYEEFKIKYPNSIIFFYKILAVKTRNGETNYIKN